VVRTRINARVVRNHGSGVRLGSSVSLGSMPKSRLVTFVSEGFKRLDSPVDINTGSNLQIPRKLINVLTLV